MNKIKILLISISFILSTIVFISSYANSSSYPITPRNTPTDFYSPNANVIWDMDDLVANSSGGVTGPESKSDGINYYIHVNVTISEKDTLIIYPNTTVRFGIHCKLIINGTLIADASSYIPYRSEDIWFTIDDLNNKYIGWGGIYFYGTNDNAKKSILKHCTISWAEYGIYIDGPSPILENIWFLTNNYGIYILNSILIGKNLTITCGGVHEDDVGLYLEKNSKITLYNSIFSYNSITIYLKDFSQALFINSTIADHYLWAFKCYNSKLKFINCTDKLQAFVSSFRGIVIDGNVYFLNTTIYGDKYFQVQGLDSSILFLNYLHVKINRSDGLNVQEAEVTIYDNYQEYISKKTDVNGSVKWLKVPYLSYIKGNIPFENITRVEVKYRTYSESRNLNMSKSHNECFLINAPSALYIPSNFNLYEDSFNNQLIDLNDYFIPNRNTTGDLIYKVENNSAYPFVNISIYNSHYLSVDVYHSSINDNWYGITTVIVNATDGCGLTNYSNPFNITIVPVNDPPIWDEKISEIHIDEDVGAIKILNLTANISDVDSKIDEINFSIVSNSNSKEINISIDAENNLWAQAIKPDYVGNAIVTIRADDGINYTDKTLLVYMDQINDKPFINITFPFNESILNGTINITGTAFDIEGTLQASQVKIDKNGKWQNASGTTTWNYEWNTTTFLNGPYTIYIRSYDGEYYSTIESINVTLKNPDFDNDTIPDIIDSDIDGDSITNDRDAFPYDADEWNDTDSDGIGDNSDLDDDNDGYLDIWEIYLGTNPKDNISKPLDKDGDGKPDGDANNSQPWMDLDDDDDNFTDEEELDAGTDPLDKDDYPVKKEEKTENYSIYLILISIIIVIIIILSKTILKRNKKDNIEKTDRK